MKYRYLHLSVFLVSLVLVGGIWPYYSSSRESQEQQSFHSLAEFKESEQEETPKSSPYAKYPENTMFGDNWEFAELRDTFLTGDSVEKIPPKASSDVEKSEKPPARPILPQYRSLYSQNKDLAGWISLDGTFLNLPVMHTPEDGQYYLYRLFDHTPAACGTPFFDGACSLEPASDNLIIHGHNMRDYTMMSPLLGYVQEEFWRAHPIINVDTLHEEGKYEIMSAFLWEYDPELVASSQFYGIIDFKDSAELADFVSGVKSRSLYDTGVSGEAGDSFITIITCSYHTPNGRLAVIARRRPTKPQ